MWRRRTICRGKWQRNGWQNELMMTFIRFEDCWRVLLSKNIKQRIIPFCPGISTNEAHFEISPLFNSTHRVFRTIIILQIKCMHNAHALQLLLLLCGACVHLIAVDSREQNIDNRYRYVILHFVFENFQIINKITNFGCWLKLVKWMYTYLSLSLYLCTGAYVLKRAQKMQFNNNHYTMVSMYTWIANTPNVFSVSTLSIWKFTCIILRFSMILNGAYVQ